MNVINNSHILNVNGKFMVRVPKILKQKYGYSITYNSYEEALKTRDKFSLYYGKNGNTGKVEQIEGHTVDWNLLYSLKNRNEACSLDAKNLLDYKMMLIDYGYVQITKDGIIRFNFNTPKGSKGLKLTSAD